jgi:hypothetical protein
MIFALTFHTSQQFAAVFGGKKVWAGHTPGRIHPIQNVNRFFGSSRPRGIGFLLLATGLLLTRPT